MCSHVKAEPSAIVRPGNGLFRSSRRGTPLVVGAGVAALLASLAAPGVAQAQSPVIEGSVVDSTRSTQVGPAAPQPLAGARVWARGLSGQTEVDVPAEGLREVQLGVPS